MQKTPTTIIFEKVKNLNTFSDTIGIRIPKDSFCSDLLKKFKKPIISTSVNISGKKFPNYFKDISESILNQVDFAVNLRREEKLDTASKIIKIKNNKIITIRS
jgi:L-threonylcarbamoyladenylate synthase